MQFKKVLLALALMVYSFSMMAYEFTINGNLSFVDGSPVFGADAYISSEGGINDFVFTDELGNFTATYEINNGNTQTFSIDVIDWCTGNILTQNIDSFEGAADVSFVLCTSILEECQAYFSWVADNFSTEVVFTNNTFTPGIETYDWDFGDGNSSTEENPTHIYNDAGFYDVTLTVGSDSCNSSVTYGVYVNDPLSEQCISSFYYLINDFSNPLAVDFVDVSIAADEIVSWTWDFGDSNTSTEQNPAHTYTEEGVYEVNLSITTESGCTTDVSSEVYVGEIIWGGDCASMYSVQQDPDDSYTFTFTDESLGDVVEWFWDFGDGNTSTEQNPTHTYSNAGTYIPALTITTDDGCTNYYCIFVFPGDGNTGTGCDAWFYAENIGQYDYQFFSGDIFGIPFESVSWDFGDGNTSTESAPIHTYADAGIYDVVLTAVTGGDTCTATLPLDVFFNDIPECEAYFSLYANDWQNPNEISFIDYSYGLTPIIAWAWDFGDGNTSTEQNPIYTYAEEGTYTVSLTITTESGCTSTFETIWTVEGPPCGCPTDYDPVCIELVEGLIIEYYNECLAICDGYEVVDCNLGSVDCEASFFWSVDAAALTVEFVDFSFATTSIVEWAWDFGDGNTSNEQNPTHTYDANNEYEVSLTIVTADGCTSTFGASFNLNGGSFGGDETMAFFWLEQNQDNLMEFTFIDQSMGDVDSWTWDFGDGNSSTAQNPTHEYAEAGIYLVTLYVANSTDGSSSVFTNLISTDTDVWYNDECQSLFMPFIQDDLHVGFLDFTWGAAVEYTWDFGDGTTAEEPFFVEHTYDGPGIYEVSLTTTTADGCTSEFSITLNLIETGFTGNGTAAAITINSNEELPTFDSFKVGPNPVQSELNINIDYTTNADATITMTNQLGQNVVTQKASLLVGTNQLNVNTSRLATGVYYLTIQTETHRETTMVVKN